MLQREKHLETGKERQVRYTEAVDEVETFPNAPVRLVGKDLSQGIEGRRASLLHVLCGCPNVVRVLPSSEIRSSGGVGSVPQTHQKSVQSFGFDTRSDMDET